MRNLLPGWIWELARRREVAAVAVLLLTGGLIWLAAHDPDAAVQENSLDEMRFGDLAAGNDDARLAAGDTGLTQTARRIPRVDDTQTAATAEPSMTAWMLSNGALDLNGEFVPPPIQIALTRNPAPREANPSRSATSVPQERVIQQLHMEDDPSVPRARLTGVFLDGEAAGR